MKNINNLLIKASENGYQEYQGHKKDIINISIFLHYVTVSKYLELFAGNTIANLSFFYQDILHQFTILNLSIEMFLKS